MKDLFRKRLSRHQQQMMRYLRYVFNDHFMLIGTFLLGGLGLYYSELLKTIPQPFPIGSGIVMVIWLFSLFVGHFATLIKAADIVFLLPKEKQMSKYLDQAYRYSLILPFSLEFLIVGAMIPLVVVASGQSFAMFLPYLVMMWSLKASHLLGQRLGFYQQSERQKKRFNLLWFVSSVVTLALGLFLQPYIGLAAALLQLGIYWQVLQPKQLALDWEKMIQIEQNRLHRIYRFINLFTDVPQITATVKRRKYLDGILHKIRTSHDNTYLYLYARRMLRGSEFSGLYLRLTLIGGFVLGFVQDRWFGLGIGILFLYLIGFQLVPIYQEFQYMTLTHLYPVAPQQKLQAVQKLLTGLLTGSAVVFSIIALVTMPTLADGGLLSLAYLLFVPLFMKGYVPKRLQKMNG